MRLLEKMKVWRRKIAAHDVTLWEVFPLLLAIVVPNVFEPAWAWRLISFFVASLSLAIICVHGLLAPEQVGRFRNIRKPQNKRRLFWLLYITGIFLFPVIVFFAVLPSSGDLYRVIQNSNAALEQKIIHVVEWGGGGSVAPFFIGQSLHTSDEIYYLPFSSKAWGIGIFEVLYSPETNMVYEIKAVQ
ncbi:MAG TPA: hypothetical protein VJI96_03535 [Candidatus Andersenbacteria bacterium]|nr:hypothetical protein [Candidatus Andersenbacteria bacterium]